MLSTGNSPTRALGNDERLPSGALSADDANKLDALGFIVLANALPPEGLSEVAAAYDRAMACGREPDLKAGSTTTRLNDFVNQGPEFDVIYLHPPLLAASRHIVGGPIKLSSFLGRTLRPLSGPQELHVDLPRDSEDRPMAGFILMIDDFRLDNGATRFVPGSHLWPAVPEDEALDLRGDYDGQAVACGPAGSMIIFDASVWHGHTANRTLQGRRSLQGYFVKREARSGTDWLSRMLPETLARLRPCAKYMLALPCGEVVTV